MLAAGLEMWRSAPGRGPEALFARDALGEAPVHRALAAGRAKNSELLIGYGVPPSCRAVGEGAEGARGVARRLAGRREGAAGGLPGSSPPPETGVRRRPCARDEGGLQRRGRPIGRGQQGAVQHRYRCSSSTTSRLPRPRSRHALTHDHREVFGSNPTLAASRVALISQRASRDRGRRWHRAL